jgi:O-antigen/teichoic acid export membrane protein
MSSGKSLKKKVIRGGISLSVRQLLVLVLSLINVLVVARMLGPVNYGIVATSLGIFYFLAWTSRLGLNVYLVRQPNLELEVPGQILGFYNTVGFFFCILLVALSPLFGWWTEQSEVTSIMRVLPLAIWIEMTSEVSLSMLKRDVRFSEVGIIEALSKLSNYVLAIIFVLLGWSYWGPIWATVLGALLKLIMAHCYHPIPWQLNWEWKVVSPALKYGSTYTSSSMIKNAKNLVVPLLVSRILGVSAVGIISIAIRFAQQIAILRLVIRDMSISVMAKVLENPKKVCNTISQGMVYQTLVVAPFSAAFACLSIWIVPALFGEEWLISTQIFPFIAFALIISSIFDLHIATLYAADKNRQVMKIYILYTAVLWGVSLIALNSIGLWGYVVGELTALPMYFIAHIAIKNIFGSPNYWPVFWLVLATSVSLFGSIFLSLYPSMILLVASYTLLLLLNSNLRKIPKDLMATFSKS